MPTSVSRHQTLLWRCLLGDHIGQVHLAHTGTSACIDCTHRLVQCFSGLPGPMDFESAGIRSALFVVQIAALAEVALELAEVVLELAEIYM